MKIVVLGGAGAMGSAATRKAVALNEADEIVVADRDGAAALALATELGVRSQPVDVTSPSALRASLADADVVMNVVGPYYRFGLAVLRAAIDTGTHYADICDDWEPTLDMLDLDDDARSAGVTAIIGMGASPGVSNLLAARAADELDAVHHVCTAWPVDPPSLGEAPDIAAELLRADGQPSAAAVHWMQQLSGMVAVVRHGSITREPPLCPVSLQLPGGRKGTAYTVGHPEPVTLHRTLRPTGDVVNAMVLRPGTAAYLDVLRTDMDNGRIDVDTAAAKVANPGLVDVFRSIARRVRFRSPGSLPPFFAAVTGTKDDEPRTVLARLGSAVPMNDMAEATGVPLALGVSQICRDIAAEPGVHAADAVIDRDVFFADLASHLRVAPADVLCVTWDATQD